MTLPNRSHRWMLPALLALAVLSLPVSGFMSSGTLNFFANFNDPQSQGSGAQSWTAFGGSASVNGPKNIFSVVFPSATDGKIEIQPNPGTVASELVCGLTVPVLAQHCDIGFSLTALGDFSDLDIRFEDVGDTGILDLHISDDGDVTVDGKTVSFPLLPGEMDVYVNIALETSGVGTQMWEMTLTGPSASTTVSGTLNVQSLSLSSIHFRRSAGAVGGIWNLDNVLVTSNDPTDPDLVPDGALRTK